MVWDFAHGQRGPHRFYHQSTFHRDLGYNQARNFLRIRKPPTTLPQRSMAPKSLHSGWVCHMIKTWLIRTGGCSTRVTPECSSHTFRMFCWIFLEPACTGVSTFLCRVRNAWRQHSARNIWRTCTLRWMNGWSCDKRWIQVRCLWPNTGVVSSTLKLSASYQSRYELN